MSLGRGCGPPSQAPPPLRIFHRHGWALQPHRAIAGPCHCPCSSVNKPALVPLPAEALPPLQPDSRTGFPYFSPLRWLSVGRVNTRIYLRMHPCDIGTGGTHNSAQRPRLPSSLPGKPTPPSFAQNLSWRHAPSTPTRNADASKGSEVKARKTQAVPGRGLDAAGTGMGCGDGHSHVTPRKTCPFIPDQLPWESKPALATLLLIEPCGRGR